MATADAAENATAQAAAAVHTIVGFKPAARVRRISFQRTTAIAANAAAMPSVGSKPGGASAAITQKGNNTSDPLNRASEPCPTYSNGSRLRPNAAMATVAATIAIPLDTT